jgi:hypothetical protein
MLARDEISDGTPKAFVDSDDGWKLHEVLDRGDGLGISGMDIQIPVTNWKDGAATPANQAAGTAKKITGIIRSKPNRIGTATHSTFERSENRGDWLGHYPSIRTRTEVRDYIFISFCSRSLTQDNSFVQT